MKAVFIKLDCLLEDSGIEGDRSEAKLKPETIATVESLAESGLFTILIDPGPGSAREPASQRGDFGEASGRAARLSSPKSSAEPLSRADGEMAQRVSDQIYGEGNKMGTVLRCPHQPEEGCQCWGAKPELLHKAAAKLDLKLDECYLICDSLADIASAYAVGCRPFLVLGKRTLDQLYGDREPRFKDFPAARDLKTAIGYVIHEEKMAQALGAFPRIPLPSPEERVRPAIQLPSMRYVGQWLLVLVLGGLWLSLGIAYLLAHLYRVQPFPAQVWYITLQFIPRPLRGLLFLASGAAVALIAFRHLASISSRNRGD